MFRCCLICYIWFTLVCFILSTYKLLKRIAMFMSKDLQSTLKFLLKII